MTFLINSVCLIVQIKNFSRPSNLFNLSLNIADLFSACYMIILSVKDIEYSDEYINFADDWKNNTFCNFCGILINFSFIFSIFSLLLMTLEKYLVVNFPMMKSKLSFFNCTCFVFSFCLISCFLSIFPYFIFPVNHFFSNDKINFSRKNDVYRNFIQHFHFVFHFIYLIIELMDGFIH